MRFELRRNSKRPGRLGNQKKMENLDFTTPHSYPLRGDYGAGWTNKTIDLACVLRPYGGGWNFVLGECDFREYLGSIHKLALLHAESESVWDFGKPYTD